MCGDWSAEFRQATKASAVANPEPTVFISRHRTRKNQLSAASVHLEGAGV
jgi:hypothetical protein